MPIKSEVKKATGESERRKAKITSKWEIYIEIGRRQKRERGRSPIECERKEKKQKKKQQT